MSKRSDITNTIENLHFLLDSGLPMVQCLSVLIERNKSQKVVIIKEKIMEGMTFNQALSVAFDSKVPNIISMFIQIGELCGNLGAMLVKAVETDKQIRNIKSSFIGAISYPLFICAIAILMMFLIMIGIVPKLLPMFRDLQVELPIYTRAFIFTSNFIIHYGIYIFIVSVTLLALLTYFYKKSRNFRVKIENIILRTWGIRSLYVRYHTSIVALCLSEYLNANYVIHNALKIVGNSTSSFTYSTACQTISEEVQNGINLSDSVKSQEKIFPNWAPALDLASRTGRLSDQFRRFYQENVFYLERFNLYIKRWAEPALMLFIGSLIAVFAISIISPIYSVIQNVQI